MTLSIERDDRRMGLASDRTVYSSKRNRPLLLYGRLLDDSRPSPGLFGSNRITSGLPTSYPVTRRFGGCQCYCDLSPTIRQNGERRATGRVSGFVFVKRMMRHRV